MREAFGVLSTDWREGSTGKRSGSGDCAAPGRRWRATNSAPCC